MKNNKNVIYAIRNGLIIFSTVCLFLSILLLLNYYRLNQRQQKHRPPKEITHKVLLLCSYNPLYYSYESQIRGLEKSLYANGIEYDVIYMDAKRYGTVADIHAFHEFLKERLQQRDDYEAIILGDDNALSFAMDFQDELFNGLPMVFYGINDRIVAERGAQTNNITGFYEKEYLTQTVELAKRLFPKRRTLVALYDDSKAGYSDYLTFKEIYKKSADYNIININTSELSYSQLVEKLESLPSDSLLFFMTAYTDINGNFYSIQARTNTVVNHTDVPIFRCYGGAEGEGILGGIVMDFEEQCRMAGETVARILAGENVNSIPLVLETPGYPLFDWQIVKKYGLKKADFPKGTMFYRMPETFLSKYNRIIPVVSFIFFALLMLILAGFLSYAHANHANEELIKSYDELQKSQELLVYQSEYDEILDIINRRTINEFIHEEVKPEDFYSVLLIDIDGFKTLNENYGHQVADSVLQYLVAILKELASNEDKDGKWKIARYGGDEFLVYIPGIHLTSTHDLIRKIMNGIHAPIPLGDEKLAITASIGISNSDGVNTPEQHIINAENAMFEAKDNGRNRAVLFGNDMQEKAREELAIKNKVEKAMKNDGFYMVYQPQVNSKTKKVTGYEALVRMKEPGVYPGQFIPVAERSGWIWKIGRITTELVIRQLADWRDSGFDMVPVSLNYSSTQLNDHGYVDYVENLLKLYDVPAKYLEIEITEGVFLKEGVLAKQVFDRFKEMGITLLMDDFGTGYSSLGYLTYIPVDVIKLDKSLVDTYLVDGKESFIKNIIRLMHDLGKKMIIEGVEEEWQYEKLKKFGADTIQGYYFSKPISADEAIVFKAK